MNHDDDHDRPRPAPTPHAAEPPPRWWRSLEEYTAPAATRARHGDEFAEELPLAAGAATPADATRRDFFRLMGLSTTAALAACRRAPEQTILPYTYKPDEIVPGVSLWYATACGACPAGCGLLVKTRDGRPLKIEGNPSHPVSAGAVCAVGQASLLGLYDADRARRPLMAGKPSSWKEVDAAVAAALARAHRERKAVRVMVPWGLGPTRERALDQFVAAHPGAQVVRFDPLGQRDAIAAAHQAVWGAPLLPELRLDAAHVVVGFDADFLGAFLAPAPLTRQWSVARNPARAPMLRHVQFEATLSLTGAAADQRVPLAPSALVPALARLVRALLPGSRAPEAAALARRVLEAIPVDVLRPEAIDAAPAGAVERVAVELATAGAQGLVICGSDDPAAQTLAVLANALLGNTGTTVVLDRGQLTRTGELTANALAAELGRGEVGVLLMLGVNPALVDRRIAIALPGVPFSLSTSDRLDESAAVATVLAPAGHFLESWNDHRPRAGVETMGQPCVAPLFDTRAETASLLAWAGAGTDAHAFLQARWRREVLQGAIASDGPAAQAAWDAVLREGVTSTEATATPPAIVTTPQAARALVSGPATSRPPAGLLQLALHASVALHDGSGANANNGWLQELPDPLSKVAWGNVAALAPAQAAALGLSDGDVVELSAGGATVRVPVLAQPGVAAGVVALAVGHGRTRAGRNATGHGVNAWPLAEVGAAGLRRAGAAVTLRKTGERHPLALTQTHGSQEGRELVREATVEELRHDPHAGNEEPAPHAKGRQKLGLWPGHRYEGHRWGLAIDLNRCTGCAACVVSCSAENNIPVVGELEVRRRRELHWLRIDRYYGGAPESPQVLHQPMMCQHCENAPCETVCPVLATVHSTEGLNQQIYNRCVGTRYCANNCPTKVRRFNWFDYPRDEVGRLVLNPDVVVRSRGVMEKCSMCVQRIEEARALARREGRELVGSDISTACQQSCPAAAITFGDANDPKSALSRARADGRAYTILEEINVKPQVTYMTRIRNRSAGDGDHHG